MICCLSGVTVAIGEGYRCRLARQTERDNRSVRLMDAVRLRAQTNTVGEIGAPHQI